MATAVPLLGTVPDIFSPKVLKLSILHILSVMFSNHFKQVVQSFKAVGAYTSWWTLCTSLSVKQGKIEMK